jgi:hypothetical protein
MHRSRVCQLVIDVFDLDQGVAFWTAALDGVEEETSEASRQIYRRIRLPDSEIRILLQKTADRKVSKERMHPGGAEPGSVMLSLSATQHRKLH